MTAVLYAIPASHPAAVAEKALQLKGMPYRRVELVPVVHRLSQRLRFGAGTVPAVSFPDGAHVIGSRAIVRALEARVPAPPLLPAAGGAAAAILRAEEWGDQVLQPLARRVVWAALRRMPAATDGYTAGAQLPVPRPVARATAPALARLAQILHGALDPAVRADLLALPAHLGRVDGWIADGTLGGEALTAADLQVAASLRLLLTIEDVRPLIEPRPAGALARRVFPDHLGAVPAGALPAAWLPVRPPGADAPTG